MTGDEVCKNCGWRLGQHSAATRLCPDQKKQASGGASWLSTSFEESGISRSYGEEAREGRYDFGRTSAPPSVPAPPPPPPPVPEQPIDPSITRDRAHIPQPVVHHQTPYDHFPDLKDWAITRRERKDDEDTCEMSETWKWPPDTPSGVFTVKVKEVRVLGLGKIVAILEPIRRG